MEGMATRFPPERYAEERTAERETERWVWLLSNERGRAIESLFPGRWDVGDFSVRLVDTSLHEEPSEVWVGTFWTSDGYPDPEAVLLSSAQQAEEWVLTSPSQEPPQRRGNPWLISATYTQGDEEEEAVAQLAKVVR